MKYIKTFESQRLRIGYYVLCKEGGSGSKTISNFIENNIGKYLYYHKGAKYPYCIEYENVPEK